MKTITTNRLTFAYLQRLDRSNGIITLSAIVFIVFSFFWMLFHVGGNEGTDMMGNVVYTLAALFGAVLSLLTAYRARFGVVQLEAAYWRVWLYTGLGLTSLLIGGISYAWLQLRGQSLFPSLADVFFNIAYLLLFLGLISIPALTGFRFRTVIDVLTTTFCLLGMIWTFIIGPVYFSHVNQGLAFPAILKLILSLIYPCWDVILILVV